MCIHTYTLTHLVCCSPQLDMISECALRVMISSSHTPKLQVGGGLPSPWYKQGSEHSIMSPTTTATKNSTVTSQTSLREWAPPWSLSIQQSSHRVSESTTHFCTRLCPGHSQAPAPLLHHHISPRWGPLLGIICCLSGNYIEPFCLMNDA